MSLEQFVQRQEDHISQHTHFLMSKNEEVERAVDDLVNTVMFYELDPHIIEDKENIHGKEAKKIKRYYFWYLYQALLNATQNSLNAMKYSVVGKSAAGGGDTQNPFFEVDVYLDNQNVKLKPDLGDIQKSINKAATAVLRCSKNLYTWNQKDRVEGKRETLYSMIAKDREIVKVILLLTGSIQGAKNIVNNFLQSFDKFAWLWKEKIKTKLDKFSNRNPSNQDYEDELKRFVDIEN
jgi:dynein heavy chain